MRGTMVQKVIKTRGLLVMALIAALFLAPPVLADDFADAVSGLNAEGYTEKGQAIDALAAIGDDRSIAVLGTLMEGNLFVRASDGRVLIGKESGSVYLMTDPVTGEALDEAAEGAIEKIRINNKLRGQLKGVLGAMTLMSSDSAKRLSAADEVFKAGNPAILPILERALAREDVATVRVRLTRARAAIVLEHGTETQVRVEAANILADFTDPDVVALLGRLAFMDDAGQPVEQDAAVFKAIQDAHQSVEAKLAQWAMLGNVFQGVSLGSVLLLAAVGLAITFGVMGVINMAHGEMVMLGAYTTFMVQEVFRTHFPGAFDWSLAVAVPAAFLVTGAVGMAIERGVIRHLYGRPLETLLATWGVSLILQQVVRTIFGPTNQEVGNPSWMSGAIETSTGLVLTYNRIWIIVFSLAVLGMLALVARKTLFGLQMRAVTQNRAMASSMGIRSGWVDALTFALGSGIAGMAGVALSQIDNVSPNLGQAYIIDSFMVVVFGGVGNLWGTLVGAFSLGILNKFLEPYAGAVLGKILVLVGIILFIQKRPRGLFALKGRSVES
ncbi:MAG: urea ABC transporter permease subunit UrtB [Alphaproteobacteria bacterium RIFOXYD12_FULL_60_8]|nr:MAG: urea ABC transporter permease subunit UrtB [Alphaproteobacteria bacterium RIFOXYD12_FULL_60_8]